MTAVNEQVPHMLSMVATITIPWNGSFDAVIAREVKDAMCAQYAYLDPASIYFTGSRNVWAQALGGEALLISFTYLVTKFTTNGWYDIHGV